MPTTWMSSYSSLRPANCSEQLAEAQRDDKRAYVRATKDGWSADELRKLGLENAAASRRRSATRKTANEDPVNA
ncbi:hypothetical protein LJ752_00795 [Arthrobacter sp. zg-Y786]|uniref:Uncharacterized protein n=1 Tax=Arthrobacter gengyunqii TaxID=2886940 RepID=A0ABS8GDR0_9MICC|nr:hypothetical protein [Arthrobacter gengyunqii]